jgi:hypothetical protein
MRFGHGPSAGGGNHQAEQKGTRDQNSAFSHVSLTLWPLDRFRFVWALIMVRKLPELKAFVHTASLKNELAPSQRFAIIIIFEQ